MIFDQCFGAMVVKEFRQLKRAPSAVTSVIVLPLVQLVLFTTLLVANVTNIPLGIIDESQTPESRELVATLTQSKSFKLAGFYATNDALAAALDRGKLDAGVIIPSDLSRNLWRGRGTTLQLLLNASNANTAVIAQGYAQGVLQSYNAEIVGASFHTPFAQVAAPSLSRSGTVAMKAAYLFNPGLVGTWFTITGILGMLLILNGSTLAAQTLIKEREAGTMEQLLMSPATPTQIILAKITPLVVLLSCMATFAMAIVLLGFHVPLLGNVVLLVLAVVLCLLCGIGLGTFVVTMVSTSRQVQLVVFFLVPPLTALAGAFAPVEAMPRWLQPLSDFDPIKHFAIIARGVMLKGSGIDVLWPNVLALLVFTFALLSVSIWRYRRQLN